MKTIHTPIANWHMLRTMASSPLNCLLSLSENRKLEVMNIEDGIPALIHCIFYSMNYIKQRILIWFLFR